MLDVASLRGKLEVNNAQAKESGERAGAQHTSYSKSSKSTSILGHGWQRHFEMERLHFDIKEAFFSDNRRR